jgi:MFS family permease
MAQAPAAETPATGQAAGDAPAPDSARRRALAALCVTMIVSYGVIYYAFPVLATQIAAGTGWSRTAVTLAYSAGNLAGAAVGVAVGRLIQRHGPRPVMTAGSVLGALAVAGIAVAPGYGWFVAAWVAAGIASAGVFYPPAFAALTTWYGPRRVAALTTLTLAAGFASTIFAPLTSALAGPLGWRGTYLLLAAVLAAVTVPAHALFLRLPWTPPPASPAQGGPARGADRGVLASRGVPLLPPDRDPARHPGPHRGGHRGGRHGHLLLGLLPGPAALLAAASVLAGAVRGVFTLTEATLVADHWGADRYAAVNGVFNAPLTAAGAIAPSIGAAIAAATGSYPALFVILAATAAAGAALAAVAPPPQAA